MIKTLSLHRLQHRVPAAHVVVSTMVLTSSDWEFKDIKDTAVLLEAALMDSGALSLILMLAWQHAHWGSADMLQYFIFVKVHPNT